MPGTEQLAAETEVFIDLVVGDDDLVRAEFDALIAACWESPCEPPPDKSSPPSGAWEARPQPWWLCLPGTRLGRAPTRQSDGRGRDPPHCRSN
jgi:hypothetical protein